MLLTTMALIHTQEAQLPRERVKLYRRAVEILLLRWQKRIGLGVDTALANVLKDEAKLRAILERLAYEAHRQPSGKQAADLPRGTILTLLEHRMYLGTLDWRDSSSTILIGVRVF